MSIVMPDGYEVRLCSECSECKFFTTACEAHPCAECLAEFHASKTKPHHLKVVPFMSGGECRDCMYEREPMGGVHCTGCIGTHRCENPKKNFLPRSLKSKVAAPVEPVTSEETMSCPTPFCTSAIRIFVSAEELEGAELRAEDIVRFKVQDKFVEYTCTPSGYMSEKLGNNEYIFELLGLRGADKEHFAKEAYGYSTNRGGYWPCANREDYGALTRLCLALYNKINPRPRLLKSADDVQKYGLKYDSRVLFPGTDLEYTVQHKFLSAPVWTSNSRIFDELGVNPYDFCKMTYGYEATTGDWPEFKQEDFDAAKRAVVLLMQLGESRTQLQELRNILESYEEDERAAAEALAEAQRNYDYGKESVESMQSAIYKLEQELAAIK